MKVVKRFKVKANEIFEKAEHARNRMILREAARIQKRYDCDFDEARYLAVKLYYKHRDMKIAAYLVSLGMGIALYKAQQNRR